MKTGGPERERAKGMNKKKVRLLTVVCAGLLAAAAAVFLAACDSPGEKGISLLLDFNSIVKGVRVCGIDLSGMTKKQALAATADISENLLGQIKFTIDVNGTTHEYGAHELGIDTDYDDVISAAIHYGRMGAFEDRAGAARDAKNGAADFEVKARAKEQNVKAALMELKQQLDKPPVEAGYVFTPDGHNTDGSAYEPGGKAKPVLIAQESMPNPLRFQYYRTDKYVNNYIPKDAGIERFYYTQEQDGVEVDIDALAGMIISAAEAGQYSITAPVSVIKPTMLAKNILYVTQMVSSWTSSYENHDDPDRNYNVAKLAGIINGVVIEPGKTWSINEQAGSRTYANGWKGALGILKGAYVTQSGGGVCQVSSTLYNAALRAGLEIAHSSRHSIISNYIPVGLDATISSGSKDLKLKNPYSTPVFIVSYVNPKEKNITVEVYGPPVVDGTHGEVILDFSSKITARTAVPETQVHYRAAETPDGKPIEPGKSRLYVKPRRGTTAQVYIHYISPDGKELEVKKYYVAKYPKITGHKYVNDAPAD